MQGYNAQAVCTQNQIVIAAEVTIDSPDFGHLEPMIAAAEHELAAAGITDTPAIVLADAGYWHQGQMEQLTGRGTVVLIPPDAGKRERPGWDGGLYTFMRRVLASDRGGELYAKRKGMIEPIFADTKFNRRCDRFQRRGRAAARSEWRLITATHNLLKLHRHQLATAAKREAEGARTASRPDRTARTRTDRDEPAVRRTAAVSPDGDTPPADTPSATRTRTFARQPPRSATARRGSDHASFATASRQQDKSREGRPGRDASHGGSIVMLVWKTTTLRVRATRGASCSYPDCVTRVSPRGVADV